MEYKHFESIIILMILLNAFVLTFVWTNIDPDIVYYTEILQDIFSYIFMLECLIKVIAYEKYYFNNGWNIFDFIIVTAGLMRYLFTDSITGNLSIIRILRVCRVLRLLKKAKRLYIIFNSFIHTIPAFVNVGSLIVVMIFIFSTVGYRLFAPVKFNGILDNDRNFQSFRRSFLTLIMVMTGEGWYEVMNALSRQKDTSFDCIENPTYEDYAKDKKTVGCGHQSTIYFFILYVFFVSLILVNLFIAVTL